MLVTKITTHVDDAKARLMTQYQGLTRMPGLVEAIAEQVQLLEDAFYPLDAGRQLANSVGAQLDNLGLLLVVERNGLSDDNYRLVLQATIAKNNSKGKAADVLNIAEILYDADYVFLKTPNSPTLGVKPPPPFLALGIGGSHNAAVGFTQLAQILQEALSAGVPLMYISTFPGTEHGTAAMSGPQRWVSVFGDATDASASAGVYAGVAYVNPSV